LDLAFGVPRTVQRVVRSTIPPSRSCASSTSLRRASRRQERRSLS